MSKADIEAKLTGINQKIQGIRHFSVIGMPNDTDFNSEKLYNNVAKLSITKNHGEAEHAPLGMNTGGGWHHYIVDTRVARNDWATCIQLAFISAGSRGILFRYGTYKASDNTVTWESTWRETALKAQQASSDPAVQPGIDGPGEMTDPGTTTDPGEMAAPTVDPGATDGPGEMADPGATEEPGEM